MKLFGFIDISINNSINNNNNINNNININNNNNNFTHSNLDIFDHDHNDNVLDLKESNMEPLILSIIFIMYIFADNI